MAYAPWGNRIPERLFFDHGYSSKEFLSFCRGIRHNGGEPPARHIYITCLAVPFGKSWSQLVSCIFLQKLSIFSFYLRTHETNSIFPRHKPRHHNCFQHLTYYRPTALSSHGSRQGNWRKSSLLTLPCHLIIGPVYVTTPYKNFTLITKSLPESK